MVIIHLNSKLLHFHYNQKDIRLRHGYILFYGRNYNKLSQDSVTTQKSQTAHIQDKKPKCHVTFKLKKHPK